jgi:hypothetical protein
MSLIGCPLLSPAFTMFGGGLIIVVRDESELSYVTHKIEDEGGEL